MRSVRTFRLGGELLDFRGGPKKVYILSGYGENSLVSGGGGHTLLDESWPVLGLF